MIVTEKVGRYLEGLREEPDPVLAEMEAHAARDRIPVVPPVTGTLLHVLALARGARWVVEVGTAIGVSTLYMARALPADGTVVSFDIDPERHAAAREYLERAGVGDRIDLRLEDARTGLRSLEGPFEMAFLDGVKAQYGDYLELTLPLLAPGGVLAVDNVLRSGAVAGEDTGHLSAEQVAQARAFNERVLTHPQLTGTVTPVGDGVLVAVMQR